MTNNVKGFTLIETMVAVLLLASAIVGPLTIASKGLSAALIAKDQITAFYLAQDAMEYVRYVRDSNSLGGGNWLTGAGYTYGVDLSPCVSTDPNAPVYCKVDSIQSTVSTFSSTDILKYDTTTHYFGYGSGTQTPQQYTRKVSIINTAATPNEAVVTVSVTWNDVAGITHAPILVRENIFKWQ